MVVFAVVVVGVFRLAGAGAGVGVGAVVFAGAVVVAGAVAVVFAFKLGACAIIFGITQNTGVKYAQSFGGFGSFGSFSRVRAILLSTSG